MIMAQTSPITLHRLPRVCSTSCGFYTPSPLSPCRDLSYASTRLSLFLYVPVLRLVLFRALPGSSTPKYRSSFLPHTNWNPNPTHNGHRTQSPVLISQQSPTRRHLAPLRRLRRPPRLRHRPLPDPERNPRLRPRHGRRRHARPRRSCHVAETRPRPR